MPLTVAERVRNHRQKVKENAEKHEAHKEKDKLRKRESRKKSVDPGKAELERKKCRERVRLHRLKKKLSASHVEFKFLHRKSASTFHRPRRDDVDRVHFSNIFSDPVTVPQFISGPFEIPELPAVEKLFKVIRKHKKV